MCRSGENREQLCFQSGGHGCFVSTTGHVSELHVSNALYG